MKAKRYVANSFAERMITTVNYSNITVFVKMKIFKIWVNIMLFCCVAFIYFFLRHLYPSYRSTICTKLGTNMSSCVGFRKYFKNLETIKKPGHDEQKTSKFR